MVNKLIFIPNDDTQNFPFCRLIFVAETFNTQFNEATNQNLLKSKKLLRQRIRKR